MRIETRVAALYYHNVYPPVDHQGRAGHVAGGVAGEVDRERAEVFGLAEIAERDVAAEAFDHLRMNLRPGWLGSVMKPPGRMAFTVILCTAQSAATARVN